MSPSDRRRIGAVLSLGGGIFLALALLPLPLTGAVGRMIGGTIWRAFGIGALGAPLLFLLVGVAGFDRLPRLNQMRVALLTAGCALLIPFVIGVLAQVDQAVFLPEHRDWAWSARLTGWLPGALARVTLDAIGVVGGLVIGFVALTALTLGTLAWHPLQRLERGEDDAAALTPPRRSATVSRRAVVEPEEMLVEPPEPKLIVVQEELGLLPPPEVVPPPRVARQPVTPDDAPVLLPGIELLDRPRQVNREDDDSVLDELGQRLLATMRTFKVEGTLAGRTSGPTVSQFEIVPGPGVKAGRIIALADDLAIGMRSTSLRVAPIPGRGAVGVEIPNPRPRMVTLGELLDSPEWHASHATLPVALGRDVEGKPVIADLARMPHLLVAGTTGSGKSVAINTIITSLIYRYTPRELRLLMIDPKMVELSMYQDLPHLRHQVVTDNNDAAKVLKWAVYEMNRRYELLHANGARQLSDFNRKVTEGKPLRNPAGARPTLTTITQEAPDTPPPAEAWSDEYREGPLPMIVVVVDELADLMMSVQSEVETPLAMLAQKARAIGIHLILATQRPSVNVLTGLIKANFPSRMAFRVASKVDSRTILDQNGAEALLGNGDMLFLPPGQNDSQRIQGAFISTDETERLMHWFKAQQDGDAPEVAAAEPDILEVIRSQEVEDEGGGGKASADDRDPLFRRAAEHCIQEQGGSTSLLQRRMQIGYGRAARIIDQLHDAGILGPANGSKAREVLIGYHQLDEYAG